VRDALVAVAVDPVAAADVLNRLDANDLGLVLAHGTGQRLGTSLAVSLRSAALPVPDWLEVHRFEAATRRARIMNGLGAIAPALDRSRIPWVVLKGPITAASYAAPEQREFIDLDILVPGDRLANVLATLSEVGIDDQNRSWSAYVRFGVAEFPVFVAGAPIDLHWHLIGLGRTRERFTVDIDEILSRRSSTTIGGVDVGRLDAEDHAIHVALHAGLSGATQIGSLRDVHETVRSSDLDWDEFVSRSRRFGAAPIIGHVLDRCNTILGTPVPGEVVSRLAPRSALAMRRWLDRRPHPWGDPGTAAFSGFAVTTARSGFRDSASRATEILGERVVGLAGRTGRWSAYDPDSPLFWNTQHGKTGDMTTYLDFAARQGHSTG
jgi:hypothetical protein